MLGEIVATIVTALVAFGVRKIELGRWRGIVLAVVEGVEQAAMDMPGPNERVVVKTVKKSIQARAEATGAQARLHAIVDRITKEGT
jgi:hypothetical protein